MFSVNSISVFMFEYNWSLLKKRTNNVNILLNCSNRKIAKI